MQPLPKAKRCLLFVPGARADRFVKACEAGADQVCIDLEDAVSLADKTSARMATLDFIAQYAEGKTQLGLRINCITSDLGVADLTAITDMVARKSPVAMRGSPRVRRATPSCTARARSTALP